MKDFLTRIAGLRAGINGGGAGASLSDGTGAASAPIMTKAGGFRAVRGSRRTGGGDNPRPSLRLRADALLHGLSQRG
jgi:hypothetical protein